MASRKQVIGGDYISRGRKLSVSRAVRAGDFVFLTGQVPRQGDQPMVTGTIEEQTRVALEAIKTTLLEAGCKLRDVVKAMVWLRDRADFPGFNAVFSEYFPVDPPARSAVRNELLVDVRIEIEVVAYRPTEFAPFSEMDIPAPEGLLSAHSDPMPRSLGWPLFQRSQSFGSDDRLLLHVNRRAHESPQKAEVRSFRSLSRLGPTKRCPPDGYDVSWMQVPRRREGGEYGKARRQGSGGDGRGIGYRRGDG